METPTRFMKVRLISSHSCGGRSLEEANYHKLGVRQGVTVELNQPA